MEACGGQRVTSGTPGIELRKSQKGKLRPGPWFIGGVGMRTKDNSCKSIMVLGLRSRFTARAKTIGGCHKSAGPTAAP